MNQSCPCGGFLVSTTWLWQRQIFVRRYLRIRRSSLRFCSSLCSLRRYVSSSIHDRVIMIVNANRNCNPSCHVMCLPSTACGIHQFHRHYTLVRSHITEAHTFGVVAIALPKPADINRHINITERIECPRAAFWLIPKIRGWVTFRCTFLSN